MDLATYAIEAEVESTHWWFVGRRVLFANEIGRLKLSLDVAVLDIGTSTGTNLRMLRELGFTNVFGLDASDEAIRFCASKGLGIVRKGDVCQLPFAAGTFDLVLATDVIEHVEDHAQAIAEIERILKPGGAMLVTVPAFQSLWGLQDDVAQHKRRYRRGELVRLIARKGLRIERNYYFNYILFAPIWLARQIIRISNIKIKSENEVNNPLINRVLFTIFSVDIATASLLRMPFGVSALVIAFRTA